MHTRLMNLLLFLGILQIKSNTKIVFSKLLINPPIKWSNNYNLIFMHNFDSSVSFAHKLIVFFVSFVYKLVLIFCSIE